MCLKSLKYIENKIRCVPLPQQVEGRCPIYCLGVGKNKIKTKKLNSPC